MWLTVETRVYYLLTLLLYIRSANFVSEVQYYLFITNIYKIYVRNVSENLQRVNDVFEWQIREVS